jgi:polyisoprenoid-binding protein YceI
MAFKISGNLGDRKHYLRISDAAPGAQHVEVTIDDGMIDREHASRLLRLMAERLLECNWPPDQARSRSLPRSAA